MFLFIRKESLPYWPFMASCHLLKELFGVFEIEISPDCLKMMSLI